VRAKVVLDVECYRNFFLVAIKHISTGKTALFELSPWRDFDAPGLKAILARYTIVTFNGQNYDNLIIRAALTGYKNSELKQLSDDIITQGLRPWDVERRFTLQTIPEIDHIDLIEVAPGQASLKIYGGRIHSFRLQDLPIDPDATIEPHQAQILRDYCLNDLDTTIDLFRRLEPQIELRERMSVEYSLDLRSKSDAQIAEAVIRSQIESIKGERIERPRFPASYSFNYLPPSFVQFTHPELRRALEAFTSATFRLDHKGDVAEPDELAGLRIKVGESTYQLGIGGIHSCEKQVAHIATDGVMLLDRDVTSYYPMIILSQGLAPAHLGADFLTVYRSIVDRRIAAKRAKDKVTDAALKITINGSFGKFGSKWSALYDPKLLIQTTVTGQLALLMLVDALHAAGIPVVSANTDGIVIKCRQDQREAMLAIFADWERRTGFQTEETAYAALYSRDVNNYLAIKTDGSVKTKGTYADATLKKTPASQICVRAVVDWLQFGLPIEWTIRRCQDIRQFITLRQVSGGAVKGQEYLGKAVRWYYARGETGCIHYRKNGNKVPKSDGAKPIMVLPDRFPSDVDHSRYISDAQGILSDLGVIN
jgi:DNA polymerase elongation subunit (family B)